jgi:hypothetical protein
MDAPGRRAQDGAPPRRHRRPESRHHQLLALAAERLAGAGGRRVHAGHSAVCEELGSPNTPILKLLNGRGEVESPTRVLVIRNADTSFVYFPLPDGVIAPVPAIDSFGMPNNFSHSASLRDARQIDLVGQGGVHDPILGTTHLGILNSPQTRQATLQFLSGR